MKSNSEIKFNIPNPVIPEQEPQRKREDPITPDKQIPERDPQRPREKPTEPQVD